MRSNNHKWPSYGCHSHGSGRRGAQVLCRALDALDRLGAGLVRNQDEAGIGMAFRTVPKASMRQSSSTGQVEPGHQGRCPPPEREERLVGGTGATLASTLSQRGSPVTLDPVTRHAQDCQALRIVVADRARDGQGS